MNDSIKGSLADVQVIDFYTILPDPLARVPGKRVEKSITLTPA